jgi:hypothetical protein
MFSASFAHPLISENAKTYSAAPLEERAVRVNIGAIYF